MVVQQLDCLAQPDQYNKASKALEAQLFRLQVSNLPSCSVLSLQCHMQQLMVIESHFNIASPDLLLLIIKQ